MNGSAFSRLNLNKIQMSGNECVGSRGIDNLQPAKVAQLVTEQCGFCEKSYEIQSCELLKLAEIESESSSKHEKLLTEILEEQKRQNKIQEVFTTKTILENEGCHAMFLTQAATIERLQSELKEIKGMMKESNSRGNQTKVN